MQVRITRQSLALLCFVSSEKKKHFVKARSSINQNHRTTCKQILFIKNKMHFKILSTSTQISLSTKYVQDFMPDLLYPASQWNCTLETSPIGWSGDWTVPEGLCQFYAVLSKTLIEKHNNIQTIHRTCSIY